MPGWFASVLGLNDAARYLLGLSRQNPFQAWKVRKPSEEGPHARLCFVFSTANSLLGEAGGSNRSDDGKVWPKNKYSIHCKN